MPSTKVAFAFPLRAALLVAVAAAVALTMWYVNIRGDVGPIEEFQSFGNHTSFSNGQVWEAYRFALANPGQVLDYIPCFCGCVAHGDTNNRDCYLDGFDSQSRPVFDPHAAG